MHRTLLYVSQNKPNDIINFIENHPQFDYGDIMDGKITLRLKDGSNAFQAKTSDVEPDCLKELGIELFYDEFHHGFMDMDGCRFALPDSIRDDKDMYDKIVKAIEDEYATAYKDTIATAFENKNVWFTLCDMHQ